VVDKKRWEPQQPQDFVRGIADDQSIPEPRPRQQNRFVITATYVTAFAPRGANTIEVDSTAGFTVGDRVAVMLDSGENYFPVVIRISGNQMLLTNRLPATVGGPYADPIENVVVDMGPSGIQFLVEDVGIPIIDDATGNLLGTS
jgi:hypothetical protein